MSNKSCEICGHNATKSFELLSYEAQQNNFYNSNMMMSYQNPKKKTIYVCDACYNALNIRRSGIDNRFSNSNQW